MKSKQLILAASSLLILCCALIVGRSLSDGRSGGTTTAGDHSTPAVRESVGSPAESARGLSSTASRQASVVSKKANPVSNGVAGKVAANAKSGLQKSDNQAVGSIQGSSMVKSPDASADQEEAPLPTELAPQSGPGSLPAGVQLAENVKLPAVILAISAAQKDSQKKIPAPIAAAMQGIVDTFYRDLADGAGKARADKPDEVSGGQVVPPSQPGETVTGPNIDASGIEVTEDTIVIHPGPTVEEARERANETYRALFGDAAYNQMTMSAVMEVNFSKGPATEGN